MEAGWGILWIDYKDRNAKNAKESKSAKVLTELAASCTLSAAKKISGRFQKQGHVVLLLCGGNESLSNMIAYTKILQA